MDPLSQVFCLRWNNHRNNLLNVLDHLLQTEGFTDVTLACDGASIKAHKMILSACSSYFQRLFLENQCEHPIVFLKDIKFDEMRAVLDYMYKGEVNVAQEQLPGLLKVAELLRVKGLVEEEREKLFNSKDGQQRSPRVTTSSDEQERPRSSLSTKINGNNEKNNSSSSSKENQNRSSSPPASTSSGMVRPFMYTPPAGGPQFPLWPIPGMFSGAHNLFDRNRGGSANDDRKEGSPGPTKNNGSNGASSAKRKKTASGSAGSNSSKESGLGGLPALVPNQDQVNAQQNLERNRAPHPEEEKQSISMEEDDLIKDNMSDIEKGGENLANYVGNQRLEWKRYKQYTRTDIMAAIEEVKKGMSALQASRKYGVPSRTLYDKVKKMGITTGRQMQRKSLPNYPASFPSLGMMNMDYKDIADRMKDMDESTNESSGPGENIDNRATMVPTSGFPALQMLNLMEKIKGADRGGVKIESEISLTPMNLSTMLSSSRSGGNRDFSLPTSHHEVRNMAMLHQTNQGRLSDSSLSPNGEEEEMEEDEELIMQDDEEREQKQQQERGSRESRESSRDEGSRHRHSSAEIRAQFMADLKRLGGNIPTQSGDQEQQTATSTTASPPPPPSTGRHNREATPPPSHHRQLQPQEQKPVRSHSQSEENLPPRKRKVSQEHRMSGGSGGTGAGNPYETKIPLNGIHEDEKQTSSNSNSPVKDESKPLAT